MAKVLVIDDEELARFTMREILESAGHEVVEAGNGREGLELQRKDPCDAVVTDIIMPEKEGIETIVELRKDFPQITIVAISGGGRTRNLDFLGLAQKFGADRILAKPFSDEDLLAALTAGRSR